MGSKLQDAFDDIRADDRLKESTKVFLASERRKAERRFHPRVFYRTFATVCAVLILALGIGGYYWAGVPVSFVSIDVNPSMELGLNRLESVVSVTAYNPQGEEILQALSLKGKKYTEAIDAVVESQEIKRYLTGEAELVFTVAARGSLGKAIEAGVVDCSKHIGHKSHNVSVDMETAVLAHDNDMSVGKYYAYLQLSQYDSTVTLDECRHMSMEEIHGHLNEHGQGDSQESEQESVNEKNNGHQGMEQESTNCQGAEQEDTIIQNPGKENSGDGQDSPGTHHHGGHHK